MSSRVSSVTSFALISVLVSCGSNDRARHTSPACGGLCDAGADAATGGQGGSGTGGNRSSQGGAAGAGGTAGARGPDGGGGDRTTDASISEDASTSDGALDASFDGAVELDGSPVVLDASAARDGANDGAFSGCLIAGVHVAANSAESGNVCRVCLPATSTTSYSDADDGVACSTCNSCSAGACVPTRLSTSGAGSFVTLDANDVYWGDGQHATGSVWRVPQAGGQTTELASGLVTPTSVLTDGNLVYFTDYGGKKLASVPPSGGIPTKLADLPNPTMALLTGGQIFIASSSDPADGLPGSLSSFTINTGTTTPLSTGGSPYELTTDGVRVYWEDTYAKTISSVPVAGGQVQVLKTLTETPRGIAVDGTKVYFATVEGGVYSMAPTGGTVTPIVSGLDEPLNLAVDGGYLYVTNWAAGTARGVVKVPVTGGVAVPLLTSARAYGLAVGASCVFTTTEQGVLRLDK